MKKLTLLVLTVLLISSAGVFAQVIYSGGTYTEAFDTLPVNTSSINNAAIYNNISTSGALGWYSSIGAGDSATGRASSGSEATSGKLYSWGAQNNPDRAYGIHSTSGFSTAEYIGLQIQNTTGQTASTLEISYVVEQWRRNTNAATMTLEYLVTDSSGNMLSSTGYITLSQGGVTSSTGSAAGLNGNLAENQTEISFILSGINWKEGDYLWLRWAVSESASSSAIALDNFSLKAVPEPSSFALAAFAFAVITTGWLRRNVRRSN